MDFVLPGMVIFMWIFLISSLILWFSAVRHLVRNESLPRQSFGIWLIIIAFLPVLGSLFYFMSNSSKTN